MQPYSAFNNNPIYFNDPTGMIAEGPTDWVEKKNGDIYWDNNATSQATTKAGETYRGKNYARSKEWDNVKVQDTGDTVNGNVLEVYKEDKTMQYSVSNSSGMVELPHDTDTNNGQFTVGNTAIYKYHNRNDMKFVNKVEQDQWGTPENVAKLINLSIAFKNEYGAILSFGDLSTETGNSSRYNLKGTRHKTHYNGSQVDIKYPTSTGGVTNSDLSASIERTQFIINYAKNIGFGHRVIGTHIAPKINNESGRNKGHNNHIHIGK